MEAFAMTVLSRSKNAASTIAVYDQPAGFSGSRDQVRSVPHENGLDGLLGLPGDQGKDLVAGFEDRVASRHYEPVPAHDGDDGRVPGDVELGETRPDRGRGVCEGHLHQVRMAAFESQQSNERADGHGFFYERSHHEWHADRYVDPPGLIEDPLVLWVVHPGDDSRYGEFLFGEKGNHEIVL